MPIHKLLLRAASIMRLEYVYIGTRTLLVEGNKKKLQCLKLIRSKFTKLYVPAGFSTNTSNNYSVDIGLEAPCVNQVKATD